MDKNAYLGKVILVGISYYDETGKYLDHKQYHGTIAEVDMEHGIRLVDEQQQKVCTLPPRLDALFPTPKGTYRRSTTGETIEDPDFMSLWHVTKVPGENNNWSWRPSQIDLPPTQIKA